MQSLKNDADVPDRAEGSPAAPAQRTTCLTDDEVLAYAAGTLQPADEEQMRGHLYGCAACCVVVAEIVRNLHSHIDDGAPSAPPLRARTFALDDVLLDRYRVRRFIARGGMGEVYEAHDNVLNETVALKTVVCTALDDPAAMDRFLGEVRTARQVTHPNVCRILELGLLKPEGGEQVPFLTMEFLPGETLKQRIARSGRLPPAEVAALLPQMVAGVAAIHAAGIVHRDLKPQNVMIVPGERERVVVTDFGLAHVLTPLALSASESAPQLAGTVDYMAPEQLAGCRPTPRFDVYALGVVIFEMLTGRKPFATKDVVSTAIERAQREPPRPSELVPGLDPGWDTLVARCLAPNPQQRLGDVREIVAPSLASRAGKHAGLLALVAVAALLCAGWGWRAWKSASPAQLMTSALLDLSRRPAGMPTARPLERRIGANGCSADMVAVARGFCVDRYEAAVVDDVKERPLNPHYPPWAPLAHEVYEDWTARLGRNPTSAAVALPLIPAYQLEASWMPRAVSRAGVAPQGHVSKLVARAACAGAGKRLCSEQEWHTACRGEHDTRFPYGDEYEPKACNVGAEVHPAILLHGVVHDGVLTDPRLNAVGYAGKMLLQQTGGSDRCRSAWGQDGVYDLVGNLDEWVESSEPAYRGGHYARSTTEGCEYRNDRHKQEGPGYYNYSIGFRCCADLRPAD